MTVKRGLYFLTCCLAIARQSESGLPIPVPMRMSLRTVAASPSSSARKLSTPCIVESPVATTTGGGLAALPPPAVIVRLSLWSWTRSSIL